MSVYQSLLLAYIAVYQRIDYSLLAEEFHVTVRQVLTWVADLKESGYIEPSGQGFLVTALGKSYQSVSWKSFVDRKNQQEKETFQWDYLYIPENFDPGKLE